MSTLSAADKLSALGVRDTEPDEFQQKKSQGLNAVPSSALEQQIIICNQELEPDPIPDLIEGFAPSQASTTLFARGGRHKTTLGMYAALCVAQGVPFLGEYGVQRGPVFWVDAEGMGRARFLQRLFELCRGMGIERPTGEKVFFFELGVRSLKDVATLEPLAAFVRKHGVVVTFLDSFTSAMRGGDSNSADDVSASMALVRELGTSIVIDHVRKDADENNPTAFGSVAKENLSRSSWAVSSQDGALILRHVKANYGPIQEPIGINVTRHHSERCNPFRQCIGCSVVIEKLALGDDRLAAVEAKLPARNRILNFLEREYPRDVLSSEIIDKLVIPKQTVQNALNELSRVPKNGVQKFGSTKSATWRFRA